MAWHSRHVSVDKGRSLRTTVLFYREDLLWVSPDDVINPYTGDETAIPVKLPEGGVVGPNILDLIAKEKRMYEDEDSGLKELRTYFVLRKPSDFFVDPEREKNKKITVKDDILSPFDKSLSTAGSPLERLELEYGNFLKVEKKSTISISKLLYKVAVGMYGSANKATTEIGVMARKAWSKDLDRALELYDLIASKGGAILESDVADSYHPESTISQAIETAVLRHACKWMGQDPDQDIQRKRGRPKSTDSESGKVIRVRFEGDTVTGSLIKAFAGYTKATKLSDLNLKQLAEILVELMDAELSYDAELMEAYLDSVDEEWRDRILEEEEDFVEPEAHDPYTVLGVSPESDKEEVKKAYRKAMRVIHPDRSGLPDYFAQIVNDAYRSILDTFPDKEPQDE